MAVGCKAYASNEKQAAINATDGNNNTRWETEFADPQWLYSDLGSKKEFDTVGFIWEGAYVFADSKKDYGKWSRKKKIKIKNRKNICIKMKLHKKNHTLFKKIKFYTIKL